MARNAPGRRQRPAPVSAGVSLTGRRAERAAAAEEHERMVAELREANRRQEEMLALRRNMLNALAHEMRTPLTVILGFADLLVEGVDGPLTPGQRDAVLAIRDAALRETHLLDDALALAQARGDAARLAMARIDLRALVDLAVGKARELAGAKGLRLEYEVGDAAIPVRAEPTHLRRAVDHLLENAVKFTPRGSVLVRCARAEPNAVLEVRDTGIGIADSDVAAIFDEFRQVEQGSTRRFGGLGLGLALVRTVVEAHGGTVEVASAPGEGSSFVVKLPLAADT